MPVQVKILKNSLPGMGGKIRRNAGLISQQSAYRVRDRAKQLVPRDTGETAENIEAIKVNDFTWVVNSSRPSTDSSGFDVPMFLEIKVSPYMRPAVEEERGPYLDALDRILDKLV